MAPQAINLSDEELIAMLREATKQTQESVARSHVVLRETHRLLLLAERIEAPLIERR